MSEVLLKIEKAVPTKIFDSPNIKEKLDTLFSEADDSIKKRYDEIKTFISRKENDEYSQIQYNDILALFKIYFCKFILNEAVEITFTEERYNVAENILGILSEEKLNAAILGKPMINAFELAIRQMPSDSGCGACLHGSTMLLLEKNFLERKYT